MRIRVRQIAAVFLLSLVMILFMALASVETAHAAIAGGTINDTCTWSYDLEDGKYVLSIASTDADGGCMPDYGNTEESMAPWLEYREQIQEIRFRSITSIGDYAFFGCDHLEKVRINGDIRYIGAFAFAYSHGLQYISIKGDACTIAQSAFTECQGEEPLTAIDLYGVEEIGESAFYATGCEELGLGEGLLEIGDLAFSQNETIEEVKIPESCRKIGVSAFSGDTNLSSALIAGLDCELCENAFDKDTTTLLVKAGSIAETWAEQNAFPYYVYGDFGKGALDLSKGPVSLPAEMAFEKGSAILFTLEALEYEGLIQTSGSSDDYLIDLNLDGKADLTLSQDTENSAIQFRIPKGRSWKGVKTFRLQPETIAVADDSDEAYGIYSTLTIRLDPMKVTGKTAKIKYSKLRKKAQTLKLGKVLTVRYPEGKCTYQKKSGNRKITINRTTGKVTIKKGLKKGKYKVKVKVTDSGGNTGTATFHVVIH